jgi:hypothetical protein
MISLIRANVNPQHQNAFRIPAPHCHFAVAFLGLSQPPNPIDPCHSDASGPRGKEASEYSLLEGKAVIQFPIHSFIQLNSTNPIILICNVHNPTISFLIVPLGRSGGGPGENGGMLGE